MSSSVQSAPVAVFAYKRVDHLRRMFSSLAMCNGFEACEVTIFVDGPKTSNDAPAVKAVRDFVKSLSVPNVRVCMASDNRGLRQSIYRGVSEILTRHERIIVLEDDLLLAASALDYFNDALRRYEANERFWSVSGYQYHSPALSLTKRALIFPFALPWGWATWRRAWDRFDLRAEVPVDVLDSKSFRTAFDMDGLYPFAASLRLATQGRVDSWFLPWYFTIFRHQGLSVFPPRRVVDNFGFGAGGTHASALNVQELFVSRPSLVDQPFEMPIGDAVDYWALDLIKASRELQVQRWSARLGYVKRLMLRSH